METAKGCYIIAEIGNNHCGSLDLCIKTIEEAHKCGASAVKLQKRCNNALFADELFNQPYDHPNSYGATYGEHRQRLELSEEDFVQARRCANDLGIDFLCTPFDEPSAVFLGDRLQLDGWKIASADLRNRRLFSVITRYLRDDSPLIISNGGYSLEETLDTVTHVLKYTQKVAALHCISSYPCLPKHVNLAAMVELQSHLPKSVVVGYSSHDNGTAIPLAARVLGAQVIEKHFTLDRSFKGTDHAMSANPTMLRRLVKELNIIDESIGSKCKVREEHEVKPLFKMIKSPYAAGGLEAGHTIREEDFEFRVPFTGLDYADACLLIGKRLKRDLQKGDKIVIDHFEMACHEPSSCC